MKTLHSRWSTGNGSIRINVDSAVNFKIIYFSAGIISNGIGTGVKLIAKYMGCANKPSYLTKLIIFDKKLKISHGTVLVHGSLIN